MANATESNKFLFEVSFDDPKNVQVEEKAEPVYKQKDLDEATAAAYAQGQADAKNSFEKQSLDCLQRIEQQTVMGFSNYQPMITGLHQKAGQVLHALLSKMLPVIMKRHGLSEVEQLVQQTLLEQVAAPKLIVRVHPTLYESIAEKMKAMAERAGYSGKIQILSDEALGSEDCRIEWGEGGAEFAPAQLWEKTEEIFTKLIEGGNKPA